VNLLFVLAVCCSLGAIPVQGQVIEVRPQDGMMDERLMIIINGLQPRQPATVRASMQDAEGRLWQSFAGFYADARGVVNLAVQEPVNGTYRGIDPMGLIK